MPDGSLGTRLPAGPLGAEALRREQFSGAVLAVAEGCTECSLCVQQCGFLGRHGTPKAMAEACDPQDPTRLAVAYQCSLCGLCTAVCPFQVDPAELYLEMRRQAVGQGLGDLPEHAGLRAYERRGTSRRYSFYALPEGCDTVFFPGCTFAGTRSEAVLALQERLETDIPNLGMVLDCCTKPSHDLGRDRFFHAMFGELRQYLVDHGVRSVLVACPNCYKVFRRYGGELQVSSVYELLAEQAPDGTRPAAGLASGTVAIHDPCVMRDELEVQQAARALVRGAGLDLHEMQSSGSKTLCCGEGGGVGFLDADLARGWSRRRREEAGEHHVVTYCAGCAAHLGRELPTSHVADLLLDPHAALAGRARVARAPFTYWRRLRLKRTLQRRMRGARTRERTFLPAGEGGGSGWLRPLLFAALLAALLLGLRAAGATP